MSHIRLANITALVALGAIRDGDVLAMLATTGNATAAILKRESPGHAFIGGRGSNGLVALDVHMTASE